MIDELVRIMEQILEQDKLFGLGAKVLKKSVDSLVAEGFSRDEAITIVATQGSIVRGSK